VGVELVSHRAPVERRDAFGDGFGNAGSMYGSGCGLVCRHGALLIFVHPKNGE
jgi:hypothetical protein